MKISQTHIDNNPRRQGKILVVDDEVQLMRVLCELLGQAGYGVEGYDSSTEAYNALRQHEFDILITDLMMPELNGAALSHAALEIDPNLIVIMMTGQGSVQSAVNAMKAGAFDYIQKPFKLQNLLPIIDRAMESRRMRIENTQMREVLAVYEFTQEISCQMETQLILNKAAEIAIRQYDADEFSILLASTHSKELCVAVSRGEQLESMLGQCQSMETGIAGWVASHREPLVLRDVATDSRFQSLPLRPGIVETVWVPMLSEKKLVGVLNLNRLRQRRYYTSGQIKALTVFANSVAVAFEAAQLNSKIRSNEERLQQVLANVDEIIYMVEFSSIDPSHGAVPFVSKHVEDIIGYKPEEFIQNPGLWASLIHPHDRPEVEAKTQAMFQSRQPITREYRLRKKLGDAYIWMEDHAMPQFDAFGNITSIFGVARDISERRKNEIQMRKLSSAVEQTADSVIITDCDGIIEYVNPAFEGTTGYSQHEVIGKKPGLVKSGQHDAAFYKKLWATLRRGEVFREIFINRRKDGSIFYEEKTITPLKNTAGQITNYVSAGKDITERVRVEEQLNYLAHHDSLTKLPNRTLLMERLKQSIAEADRYARLVAVLFLDLDRFKNINDSLGHEAGDELLKHVAIRLTENIRLGDTVARHGGDEFTVVLANLAKIEDIHHVVQKIIEQFKKPFLIRGMELFISPSIGITVYPHDDKHPEILLQNADTALYHAKSLAKGGFQFYTVELNQRMARQLDLEMGMRRALEQSEFQLHFQPQVDMVSKRIYGLEVLIRWHRDGRMITPLEFIPLAEDTGLIVNIGEWVLRTACAQAKAWQSDGIPPLKISVNISPRQFSEATLIKTIQNILHETDLDPGWLMLEITESAIMHNPETALQILNELASMGVSIAVDDFGTGYSSLGYLKRFPIDSLKIDKSFIQELTTEPDDAAITQAIIRLAHTLGIKVVAEGVETKSQLLFLHRHGCNAIQGYYFSKPLPKETAEVLLRDDRRLDLPVDETLPENTLLVVDDEKNIRNALVRVLRPDGYRILTAADPHEALELLAQQRVGVIVCDQRMPMMTGVELLTRVKGLYPQIVRIVLSGVTDVDSVTSAINRGAIYKYLTKPWDDAQLSENIREAFQYYIKNDKLSGKAANSDSPM